MVQNLEDVNKNLQEQPQNYINDIRPPEMVQNQGDLNAVVNPSGTNLNTQQSTPVINQNTTQTIQTAPKTPVNTPKVNNLDQSKINKSRLEAIQGIVKQGITDKSQILDYLNKTQEGKVIGDFTADEIEKVLSAQPQTSSLFGYSTTPEEREARNLQLAQGIIGKTQDFNQNRAYLEKTIKSYAPNVTDADIQNTIGDIENKFNTLKKNKLITEKIGTQKATDLVNQVLTDEEVNYLKTSDPNKYNEYIKAKDIKDYNDMLNGKKADLPTMDIPEVPTLDLAKIRSEIYDTPDFKASKTTLIDKKAKLDEIQDQIDSTMNEVEKQFKGTGATRGEILREANRRIESSTDLYKQAKREYDKALSTYTMFKDEADTKYDTSLKQYELNRQVTQDKIDNFKLQYGIYKDQQSLESAKQEREDKWNMLYAQQDFAKEQATTAFEQKYGNIESKDPNIQKLAVDNAVSDIMEQYKGRQFSRSKGQMIDDVLNQVKQGKSLGQALSDNITGQLQKNPTFNAWMKSNSTPKTDYIEVTGSDGKSYMVDKNNPGKRYEIGAITPTTDEGFNLLNAKDGTKGGQCGSFVNKVLGTNFGNSLDSKINKINSATPSVGSAVVMSSADFPQYGHVAVVTNVYDDGSFDIKESNWGGDEKVHSRNIKADNQTVKGFYNPNTTGKPAEEVKKINGTVPTKEDVEIIITNSSITKDKEARADLVNNLIKKGYSLEEIKSQYPTKQQELIINDIGTTLSTVQKDYEKKDNTLKALQRTLSNPNATGRDVDTAIKSFVGAIDNTAAMQGEVDFAKNAGQSFYDKIAGTFTKNLDGTVPPETLEKIKSMVYTFNNSITQSVKDYYTKKNKMVEKQYGKYQSDLMTPYTPSLEEHYPDGTKIQYDGKGNYSYYGTDKQWTPWTPEGQDPNYKNNYSQVKGATTLDTLNNLVKGINTPAKNTLDLNIFNGLIK